MPDNTCHVIDVCIFYHVFGFSYDTDITVEGSVFKLKVFVSHSKKSATVQTINNAESRNIDLKKVIDFDNNRIVPTVFINVKIALPMSLKTSLRHQHTNIFTAFSCLWLRD